MNVTHEFSDPFDLGGMTITGLGEGEEAIFTCAVASGNATGTSDDLTPDNILEFPNATNVEQVTVDAGDGDAFYIDDFFL